MLVSKNPYVVEARQNLTSKSPHFALKTGEKFTQTYRLNSLIFIVEKYGNKLLFGFLSKKKHRLIQAECFYPCNVIILFLLTGFVFKQITYCLLQW